MGGGVGTEQRRVGTRSAQYCLLLPGLRYTGPGYSQHSERPQPLEGVHGEASESVVAQDPAEKHTAWLALLPQLPMRTLSTLWPSPRTWFIFPIAI